MNDYEQLLRALRAKLDEKFKLKQALQDQLGRKQVELVGIERLLKKMDEEDSSK